MSLLNRTKSYFILMRFHQPTGLLLLLWPTLWALWIAARGFPGPWIFFVFIAGVILMRAGGCAINDFADRHFDSYVKRTQYRPLAQGKIQPAEALGIFILCSAFAFALVLTLNKLTILLAVTGVVLTFIYPFLKRYTHLPQLVLGLAFAWGIPMAFAAQTGHVPAIGWYLLFITFLWIVVYDTVYAMADHEDDRKIGIKSLAILLGRFDRISIALLQIVIISLLIGLGIKLQFTIWYFLGIVAASFCAGYQQYLIKERNPQRCFQAFLVNRWLGLWVFVGILLTYGFRP